MSILCRVGMHAFESFYPFSKKVGFSVCKKCGHEQLEYFARSDQRKQAAALFALGVAIVLIVAILSYAYVWLVFGPLWDWLGPGDQ